MSAAISTVIGETLADTVAATGGLAVGGADRCRHRDRPSRTDGMRGGAASRSRIRALTLAAALVTWKGLVAPRISPRWLVPIHAVLGGVLVARTDAPLGLRAPALSGGVRLGVLAAGAVSAAVAASVAVPAVRRGMVERELPPSVGRWLLVRIPVGTVWPEEAAFRGALRTVAAQAFGPTWGRLLQAATFGLWHVTDARRAGDPVVGTVIATGAAGWVFGWLYDRSASLAAPMLAHLAINEAGAVAALVVAKRGRREAGSSRSGVVENQGRRESG